MFFPKKMFSAFWALDKAPTLDVLVLFTYKMLHLHSLVFWKLKQLNTQMKHPNDWQSTLSTSQNQHKELKSFHINHMIQRYTVVS